MEADKEAQTLIITLTDKVKNVDVELSFTVFEEYNAIARSVKVINKSADDVKIQRVLSANVDFKDSKFEMIQLLVLGLENVISFVHHFASVDNV